MTDIDANIRSTLTNTVYDSISNSKVLVVGAGGIGCEVLKNLVLTGFKNIVILDLDTIDVSNLNRQFLFRFQHVGMSKAVVARESALKFNPNVNIEALHTKIQDPLFNYEYMSKFDVVISALDNVAARKYVNRLCYMANVPLIESGTHGYSGQTYSVLHSITECKECQKTSAPKTYAVCTIRNTPEEPVHCIAWAKFVYDALFGPKENQNEMSHVHIDQTYEEICMSATDSAGNEEDKEKLAKYKDADDIVTPEETERIKKELELLSLDSTDEDTMYAYKVFLRYFTNEIYAQRLVKSRWIGRTPPKSIFLSEYLSIPRKQFATIASRTHAVQDISVYIHLFIDTIKKIRREQKDMIGSLTFTKDDEYAVDFVTCASIIRMYIYNIKLINEFETIGIASNIVHAIATTNAIASGYSVLEAIKCIQHRDTLRRATTKTQKRALRELFKTIFFNTRFPRVVDGTENPGPSTHCYCGNTKVVVRGNMSTLTLQDVYTCILQDTLPMLEEPSLTTLVTEKSYGCLDDVEEDAPELLNKSLFALGWIHGEVVVCTSDDGAACNVQFEHDCGGEDKPATAAEKTSGELPVIKRTDKFTMYGVLSDVEEDVKAAKARAVLAKQQEEKEYFAKQAQTQAQKKTQTSTPAVMGEDVDCIDLDSEVEDGSSTNTTTTTTGAGAGAGNDDNDDDVIELD